MEVHHHGHHEGKKTWKSYIWEFLMLFFAVFCGFMAEWELEHVIENQREKEYMHSIVEDIDEDIAQTDVIIKQLEIRSIRLDSLLAQLSDGQAITNSAKAYQMWVGSMGFQDFIQNDRTIQQLKSSGSLRLIRVKSVSDIIMQYDQTVKRLEVSQEVMNAFTLDNDIYNQFFDFINLKKPNAMFRPIPLTAKGKTLVNEAYANRLFWKQGITSLLKRLKMVNQKGHQTVDQIRTQYKM